MDLATSTENDLATMLQASMGRIETLTRSATEKFKLADGVEWDDSLHQEGVELLQEAQRLLEDTEPISQELERRLGPTLLEEQLRISATRANRDDQRWYRKDLTTRTVPVTRSMDELIHMH